MGIRFGILIIATLLAFDVKSQDNWGLLGMVTFNKTFDEDFGMELLTPQYSPIVLGIDGKEMEIEGYFIALDGKKEQNHFMLSKFPQSTCFFCGKAGPETAMQVFLADGKKQKYSDEKIKVKGILRINTSDPTGLLYTLEQAKSL
jgi:hypothetical protein